MTRFVFFAIYTLLLTTSCKELFTPDVETRKLPFVVEGLISDEAKPYSIRLTRAAYYDNTDGYDYSYTAVGGAKVTVSDDCGNTYNFMEYEKIGVYVSDPAEFVGAPGRSYTLFIKTSDNQEYRSTPQLLLPSDFNVKVESEFAKQEQLVDNGTGELVKEPVDGANIFYTIENNEDTIIRFRFDHILYKEYIQTPPPKGFGCWDIMRYNEPINITNNYGTLTNNIEKHLVCFVPDVNNEYWTRNGEDYVRRTFKRITKIIQYRLNNETYQFYKNNYTILAATGKIFDPIPYQVKGNLKCISDNASEVLGFFEASSVRVRYYALNNFGKILYDVKSYEPPCEYCCFVNQDSPPDFWVY